MIKVDSNTGEAVIKGDYKSLANEFMMIYYGLEKLAPDALDEAIDSIEKLTAHGLGADDLIKNVVDMHGLG